MTRRDVVRAVLEGKRPPHVPWACAFTNGARRRICDHFGSDDLHSVVGNHILYLNHVLTRGAVNHFEDVGNNRARDHFGVVWNRSESPEVGVVENCVLPEPSLAGYEFPDPDDPRLVESIPALIERHGDCFRVFCISHSLYERACTMRGTTNLLTDFYENPGFVKELFDELIDVGVNCVNPFQPEVLDAESLLSRYRGRLTFHGGLSTQHALPHGSPEDVRRETRRLIELGRDGSYIFGPSNAACDDVPLENMLAFLEELRSQSERART
ncbi:MAG: uroporphyrinogen-III decarboxylase-like protein [Pirellulaceae bacterium]|nr:uroporphyrinogen-III decarboxylase-like protein [Pirellulaceae bacterium]